MKKRYRRTSHPMMRRSARVFLNDLNTGKTQTLFTFLTTCHDAMQYFVDLFWQRQDGSADLADLPTVHRGRDRFGLTTRLAQALAKQAKELVRSALVHGRRKPRLRRHVVTLYAHFVRIEPFRQPGFDWAIVLTGSGAPRLTIPLPSTRVIVRFLSQGWTLGKSIRLGGRDDRLYIDLLFDKPRPPLKDDGAVVGMDSNYKAGLVFSDGQQVGAEAYAVIQTFTPRQQHTYAQITSLMGHAIRQLDWSQIRMLCVENLKHVQRFTRGTFPRSLNRRRSHWLYASLMDLLARRCEEHGVRFVTKSPWKTSQFCRVCRRWDRRNRRGAVFCCVHCGFSDDADHNAAHNLALLGLAGVYGLRSLTT